MTLHSAITGYLQIKGIVVANSTLKRLRWQLSSFERFMKISSIENVYNINIGVLILWVESLKKRGCAPYTVYCTVHVVRSFFDWLVSDGELGLNPFPEDFYSKRPAVPVRRAPSVDQVNQTLESAEKSEQFPNRNRAIIGLAYSSGLRRMEIYTLNLSDVSGDEILAIGKGGKERIVPLGKETKKWIDRYIRTERTRVVEQTGSRVSALFLSRYGRRISYGTLGNIAKVQIGSGYPLHYFRHACVTHMLKNGASSRVLQKLLGHERLSTTQIYTTVDVSDLHNLLNIYHPRSKQNGL